MILAHLNAFCSDSDRQPVLQAPWSEGSHSYASNGNILIRVDRLQEVPERGDAPRNVDVILLNKDARTPYTAIQEPAGSDMEGCPTCKGTGRCDCPRCSASHDCGTCKGFGAVDAYTPVGDQHFKTKSVRLLRALAAEWQVTGQPSIFFRFEGGMGVVLAKAKGLKLQALSDIPPNNKGMKTKNTKRPTCKKCGSPLKRGYCSDLSCPFSSWPQNVDQNDIYSMSTLQVQAKYGIQKRNP